VSLLYCTVLYLGHVLPVDLHVLHSYRSCCEPAVLYCSVLGLCAPC
jgi:hypothetical protein